MPGHHAPSDRTRGDVLHSIAKSIAGEIPLLGTAAAELLDAIVIPPLQRRREGWLNHLAQRLLALEEDRDRLAERLREDPAFIDTFIQASRIAIGCSQEEKLQALRNAVVNAAASIPPDQSEQQIFLRWIEDFTVWHIRMLHLFDDPTGWFAANGRPAPSFSLSSSTGQVLTAAYPELAQRRDFYDHIASDLKSAGLADLGLHTMMSETGALNARTSPLGRRFLRFIGTETAA